MIRSVVLVFATALCYAGANIIRPCQINPPDFACLRDNFAANSNCSRGVRGFIPEDYVVPEFRFEVPWFNASVIETNLIVRNHDKCFLTEFFFDVDRDISVISIDCPNFDLEAERLYLRHLTQRQDAEYHYHIRGVYRTRPDIANAVAKMGQYVDNADKCCWKAAIRILRYLKRTREYGLIYKKTALIRLTMTIRHTDVMNACAAFTYSEVSALPRFIVRPTDKPTANFLSRDLSALNIFEIENFLWRAGPVMKIFINSYICDFNCI